jgi:hypothetical protein
MNQEARVFYNKVVELVKAETFLEENEILKGNKEESVMARKILVSVLAKFLTDSEISKLTDLKKCSISQIKTKCELCNDSWSCKKTKDKILRIIQQNNLSD